MNRFTEDPLAAPFWEGCRRGELMIQRCEACGGAQSYPRSFCGHCHAPGPRWIRASGRARVYAVTRIDRAPVVGESGGEILAIVELEEGPRLLTHIVDAQPDVAAIGARVSVRFDELFADDPPYPVFTLEGGA